MHHSQERTGNDDKKKDGGQAPELKPSEGPSLPGLYGFVDEIIDRRVEGTDPRSCKKPNGAKLGINPAASRLPEASKKPKPIIIGGDTLSEAHPMKKERRAMMNRKAVIRIPAAV